MRKKTIFSIVILAALLAGSACNKPAQSATPPASVTPTPVPTVTCTPSPTPMPTSTSTPVPTATCTPSLTPAPTNTPVPTATCAPTATPTNTPTPMPTSTSTPTPMPTATSTPTPTPSPTSTPAPTNTPTPVPTATSTPTPIVQTGLPELVSRKNTEIEGDLLTSEEEVNDYLFYMAQNNYYKFGILVEDLSLLHSEQEYLQLFPEFMSIEFESLTEYRNGYYLRIGDLTTTQMDISLRYALRTGDTSVLTDIEQKVYDKLHDVAKELNLEELDDIEAIIAAHDYLILNTAYDEATAAAGTNGPSHYAEGPLLNNMAVCSGYASAFQLLMTFADIECEYVFSDTHAWNLVKLDDTWYHIDVTWDDPVPDQPGTVIYTHFLMTDAEVSSLKEHENWSCECREPHNCNDESYRLYPYRNYLCSDETEAKQLIQQQAGTGKITLVYPAEGSLTENILLDLTYRTLQLTGNMTYFPADDLGSGYYLLRIIIK